MVDTSVWIAHFRKSQPELVEWLSNGLVMMHPFIVGELACGNLKDRRSILSDLNALPSATVASNEEVVRLLDGRRLWGRGLGWIDTHLLASSLLSGCGLRTIDRNLAQAATELGLA